MRKQEIIETIKFNKSDCIRSSLHEIECLRIHLNDIERCLNLTNGFPPISLSYAGANFDNLFRLEGQLNQIEKLQQQIIMIK